MSQKFLLQENKISEKEQRTNPLKKLLNMDKLYVQSWKL